MKNRYVAKISDKLGYLHEYELSPRFDNIEDCQSYINNTRDIILIEEYLTRAFFTLLRGNFYKKGKRMFSICLGGSFIRVYDLEQKRFLNGFDL